MTTPASASRRPSRIASSSAAMFEPRPDIIIAILGFAIFARITVNAARSPAPIENSRLVADISRKQRDHYLVMPDKGKTTAAARNRPAHDISQRTILLYEIKIRCVKVLKLKSQIANDRHGLEKNLGQHNRRPKVQVDAAVVEFSHQRTEQPE